MGREQRTWIQTYTGKAWDLVLPCVEDVCLEDIAHALSNLCRFTGHCSRFYSVAEHCIRASNLVYASEPDNFELQIAALLHDAHEAYLGDWSSPLKKAMSSPGANYYQELSLRHDSVIAKWAGFDPALFRDERIVQADLTMLAWEARELMAPPPKPWIELPSVDHLGPLRVLSPMQAEARFIELYEILKD